MIHAVFTSRRKLAPLILTSAMQRDAFQIDRDRAARRRDMRAEYEAVLELCRAALGMV